jgi:phage terminase large subunit-like protein
VRSVPPRTATQGPDAVDLAAVAGLHTDPWQADALDDILGLRADGLPAARTACIVVPRQNGKGTIGESYTLEGLFLAGTRLITYTAHEYRTAQEMFLRIRQLIESTPALDKRVASVRLANGEQAIELRSGARLKFMARTSSSGRGFTGDRIILDEAQHLTAAQMAALAPTIVTRPDAQVLMMGSAPRPEAEVLPALMDRGRAGDPTLCYLEYSVPDPTGRTALDLDDRTLWAMANPGYGIRLSDEAIAAERSLMDAESFARERLGVIAGGGHEHVIDPDTWAALADPGSQITGPMRLAIDVSPNRDRASIAVAGDRADGRPHIEVIAGQRGTEWIVDRIAALVERWSPVCVRLDPAGHAGALIDPLATRGIHVETVTARQMGQACGTFLELVETERLRHLGQPTLNAAVDGARQRPIGEQLWGWARATPSTDITPLVAVTLALRDTPPPASARTGRVWSFS